MCAAGEAEAMCAFLDAQGLVDGCITSDGDAFLYGAQTVYRNFNMNTKVLSSIAQTLWKHCELITARARNKELGSVYKQVSCF